LGGRHSNSSFSTQLRPNHQRRTPRLAAVARILVSFENAKLLASAAQTASLANTFHLPTKSNDLTIQDTISIRVQYNETDGQARVHHAQYLNYFERGRVELMRARGHSYREFEASGLMLVVVEMNVKYLGAAVFDDQLMLNTRVVRSRGVRIHHAYELTRPADELGGVAETIVTATSTIACIDRDGKVRRLPAHLRDA
jgi:acyl-CoA thioester hydrolase